MTRAKHFALDRLQQADWLKSPALRSVFGALDGGEGRVRAVGGVVRDTLLGLDTAQTDVDLATDYHPEEVVERLLKAGLKSVPTGIEHGTVTAVVDGEPFEITSLRRDIETDGRHAKVLFGRDWSEDAARRDFTMNALYCDANGTLLDPLNGLEDCLSKRVRFIGLPEQRIAEDRLRVFRFFRFSASHGDQEFDPSGLAACRSAAGDLSQLSAERVGQEMQRMLALSQVALTLETMSAASILPVPDAALDQLRHLESFGAYIALETRMAILSERNIKPLQERWRLSNAVTKRADDVIAAAKLITADKRYEVAYRYPEALDQAALLCAAQSKLGGDAYEALHADLKAIEPGMFPVKAVDLASVGILPGPAMGKALTALETLWIESGFTLDRASLLASLNRD